jgi:hypothetical protein
VILGGSALALLGVVTRTTDDCDVLDPEIPATIAAAARDFAAESGIDADWLNSKAHDFVAIPGCLPEGWTPLARRQLTRLAKELGYDAVI